MGSQPQSSNKTIFFNVLSTVILQGMAFLTGPIFSRMLGTENYGVVTLFNTWVSVFAVIFTLQPGHSLVMAQREYPQEEQKAYRSSMLFLSACFFAVCACGVLIFLEPVAGLLKLPRLVVVLVLLHSFATSCVGFMNTILTYDFKADKNFILAVTIAVANIALSILLISMMDTAENYYGRILGSTSVYAVAAVIICANVWIKGKCFINTDYWKFAVPLTIPLILHSLSNLILGQSDRVMLQWFMDNSAVGIYGLAYSFASVLASIWNAFNNSWVPYFHQYMREGKIDEVKTHARNYLELFTVLSVGFVLLAREVYHIFAPAEFWGGTDVVYAIAAAHYFTLLYSFAVNYELYHKKTKAVAVGTLMAAAVNIVLNYVLLQFMGIMGVAVATALSVMFKWVFHHINAKRLQVDTAYPFAVKMFLPYLGVFLAAIGITFLLSELWWLRWGLGACIGVWELAKIWKRKVIF